MYTLLEKIRIGRPIIFLCGPNYNKNDETDRRRILQQFFKDNFQGKYLPLVVDDFLREKNINDKNISIQLMEEICAAVSVQTYIFLDTMSAATELGIFANSAFSNKIKVFIPQKDDIFNRGNVGYFVRDDVLKSHPGQVESFEYRPKVNRKVIATDFVAEHYAFVGNTLPENIKKDILTDPLFKIKDDHEIRAVESPDETDEAFKIHFTLGNDTITIHTSIRLLFYTTVSIIHYLYTDILTAKEKDFTKFDIGKIEYLVKVAFVELINNKYLYRLNFNNIILSTVSKIGSWDLVHHITKFVHVYYLHSAFDGVHLMKNASGMILQDDSQINTLYQLLKLSEEEVSLLGLIKNDKESFFEELEIKKGKKIRKIVKYRDDEKGAQARILHDKIGKCLTNQYTFNSASFAYQKHKNIKGCVEKHLNNKGFAKYDIKSFFNSIKRERAAKTFVKNLQLFPNQENLAYGLLDACFWKDELPLGLTLSPFISDIYLHDFDETVANAVYGKGWVYTRYADDILISGPEEFSKVQFDKIDQLITKELKKCELTINKDKVRKFNFDAQHSFVRYLGINIIKCKTGNYLSVGREYIYNTAREYLEYQEKIKDFDVHIADMDEKEELKTQQELFYKHKELVGKIGFIRGIEGERGCDRFRKRLKKYYPNIDLDHI